MVDDVYVQSVKRVRLGALREKRGTQRGTPGDFTHKHTDHDEVERKTAVFNSEVESELAVCLPYPS